MLLFFVKWVNIVKSVDRYTQLIHKLVTNWKVGTYYIGYQISFFIKYIVYRVYTK